MTALREWLVWQPSEVGKPGFDFQYVKASSARNAVRSAAVSRRHFDHVGTLVETYLVCPIDETDVVWADDALDGLGEHARRFQAWVERTGKRADVRAYRLEVDEETIYRWSLDALEPEATNGSPTPEVGSAPETLIEGAGKVPADGDAGAESKPCRPQLSSSSESSSSRSSSSQPSDADEGVAQ